VQIFLAEDNPGDVMLVQHVLATHGIQCDLQVVGDGAEALAFVASMGLPGEKPFPDLFLVDLNLPKVDGAAIIRELRKRPESNRSPIIVITSSSADRDRQRAAELGVSRYFRKPSSLQAYLELGTVIREVMTESMTSTTGNGE
jgi:two-component system, chemotaxis family, response regulator Rcp1